jgi:hypothetical protein
VAYDAHRDPDLAFHDHDANVTTVGQEFAS